MAYTENERWRRDHATSLAAQIISAQHAEAMITHEVVLLRSAGLSWSEVSTLLGCSRQAAAQRFGWINVPEYLAGYVLGACGCPRGCPGTLLAATGP